MEGVNNQNNILTFNGFKQGSWCKFRFYDRKNLENGASKHGSKFDHVLLDMLLYMYNSQARVWNWDELKAAFRSSPIFHFDWFVKSHTSQELARRCDALIRLVEKENQEFDEQERQARKEKKLAKASTPSKRVTEGQAIENPSPNNFKKTQLVVY